MNEWMNECHHFAYSSRAFLLAAASIYALPADIYADTRQASKNGRKLLTESAAREVAAA